MWQLNRVAVLTSGGALLMNAAILAVVRSGIDAGLDVFGVRNGIRRTHRR